jgi:hypothetical protein
VSGDQSKWYDRQLSANVVGGLIVAVIVWGVPALISEATKANLPFWAYLVVAGVALLFGSTVIPVWRRATWGNMQRFATWALAIRPVTAKQRAALIDEGYENHKTEVETERERARQPRWSVSAEDRLMGDMALHWLHNHGYAGYDVRLTADSSEFRTDGEVFFRGQFGDARPGGIIGKYFRGAPTEKGRMDGVTFTVTWLDEHGNDYSRQVFMSPEEIRKGADSATDEARSAGWKEGYAQAKEFYENAIAEADASRLASIPLPAPRWMIAPENTDEDDVYVLRNSVPRSVAREVRLDADPDFKIVDAGHWQDLSGTETGGASGTFKGVFTPQGITFGVKLSVKWFDEHGKQQVAVLFLRSPDETSTIVNTTLVI